METNGSNANVPMYKKFDSIESENLTAILVATPFDNLEMLQSNDRRAKNTNYHIIEKTLNTQGGLCERNPRDRDNHSSDC